MKTSRDVYEVLVGAESNLGTGDLAEFLTKWIAKRLDSDKDETVSTDEAEEFARELSEAIADGDEFDAEEGDLEVELESDSTEEADDLLDVEPEDDE